MSNIGSFFNLGSQTTLVNKSRQTLRLQLRTSQDISDNKFVFPPNQGDASGNVLATDGSGNTSWVAPSGGSTNPGGDANAIQFKGDNSDFSGVSNLTFNSTTNVLGVSGDISTNTLLMNSGIRIGDSLTGNSNQNSSAIAIGTFTGQTNQSISAIAIGSGAGNTNQGSFSVAIGTFAARENQNSNAIAIGQSAGFSDQNSNAIAIGESAGFRDQNSKAIAIGFDAGFQDQSANSIAIGSSAGNKNLGQNSIAIGYQAEIDNNSANVTQNVIVLNATDSPLNSDVSSALFIKPLRDVSSVSTPAGRTRTDYKIMVYDSSSGEVAFDASYNGTATGGSTNPGGDANAIQFNGGSDFSGVSNLTFNSTTNVLGVSGDISTNTLLMNSGIRIGDSQTGNSNQNSSAIAIGSRAGNDSQGTECIAIGTFAGQTSQGSFGVAIGNGAGNQDQSMSSVAIGNYSGNNNQGPFGIAIGTTAGQENQNEKAIAIGLGAGHIDQSNNSIAIGCQAGNKNLGQNSIAIGYQAEIDNNSANVTQNVIVLNATESSLNSDVSSALFIKPLRDVSSVSTPAGRTRTDYKIMVYDSSSGEVAFDASYNGTATGGSTNPGGDANAIQFNGGSDFSGVSNLTFNSTTNTLDITGLTTIDSGGLGNGLSISNSFGTAIDIDANSATGINISNASTAIGVQSGSIEINNSNDFDRIKFSDSVHITNDNSIGVTNSSIRIGQNVGKSTDTNGVISIGNVAGNLSSNEITDSIFIGNGAETIDDSMSNVIVFNTSSDTRLDADVSSALFIKPLRDVSSVSTPAGRTRTDYKIMVYDSSSGEVAFDASYNGTATGGSTIPGGNANAIQFNGGSDFSGVSNLTFNSTTNVLGVSGDISLNGDIIFNGGASDTTITSDASLSIIAENGDIVLDASLGVVYIPGNFTVRTDANIKDNLTVGISLDVSGDTTLNSKLDVSGDTTLNSNLDVSGATTLNSNLNVSGATTFNSSVSINSLDEESTLTLNSSSSLVMKPKVFNEIDDFSGQNLEPASSILIFDYSNNQNVDCSLNYDTSTIEKGQHLSIFYLNRHATPGNLRIDFGSNNIVAGSGANRYLTFNSFGQSAELLAYGNNDNVDNNNNYLVFNTGATLENDIPSPSLTIPSLTIPSE